MPTIRVWKFPSGLSLYSFYIWSTHVNSSVGFRAKAKVNEILKFTSFKVVIPELALKDLDAKTESRLVRYPGTFKVHLSLMKGQKS